MTVMTHTETGIMNEVDSLLQCLRQQTRQDHHELDHHPLLQRLLAPGLDRDSYAGILHAMYQPQWYMEASVEAGCQQLGLDPGRLSDARSPLLARDLAALGWPVPSSSDEAHLLTASSPGIFIGQRYVVEGARKGSIIVARQLRQTLGSAAPMSYFSHADPEPNWREFTRQLESLLPTIDRNAAITGARDMFHAFQCRLM